MTLPQQERSRNLIELLKWLSLQDNGATTAAMIAYTRNEVTQLGATDKTMIVEEPWMVKTILVADQCVGDTTQIQEAVPVRIVAGYSGDFNGKDETDVA